jgi:hypothetical protein
MSDRSLAKSGAMPNPHSGLVTRLSVDGNSLERGLFDDQPIELDGFTLTSRAAVAVGKPTLDQWTRTFAFACATQDASPFWVGDLLCYAERRDWHALLDQAIAVGAKNYALHTLDKLAYLSRHVQGRAREMAPTVAHASEVAALDPAEQAEWLEKARDEGWTVLDLRVNIRKASRSKILTGRADTMHTIEVSVQVEVEAVSAYAAEQAAWSWVKQAVKGLQGAKVIAARSRQ